MTDQQSWQEEVYDILKAEGVEIIAYVPDAGHAHTIQRAIDDLEMEAIVLTTEEEGVALASGAWLGGKKAVVLMQSSGVGNCINMLGLIQSCSFPFLALVTMRGEWKEFNPWQEPMGKAIPAVFEAMGVEVRRVEQPDDVTSVMSDAVSYVFAQEKAVAVLLSQEMIGAKRW